MSHRALILALLLLFPVPIAAAQEKAAASAVEISGLVAQPGPVALTALPQKTVAVTQVTSQGEFKGSYAGVALWDVLAQAKVIDPGKGALLQRTVTITGRDGYAVVLSFSEINPDYGNNGAILATARDGASLSPKEGLRLVVPKDRRAGRAVRDVAKIEVK